MEDVENAAAAEAAPEGDFTGTATGADGADNTTLPGETFPAGDEPEPVNPVLGDTIA